MAQEIESVDLTQTSKSLLKLDDRDIVIALATGGIGLLIKKFINAVWTSPSASTVEQIDALRKLIRDCKEAGVTRISAKLSQPAFKEFTASAKDLKISGIQEYQDACVFSRP